MLNQQTMSILHSLKLFGMAKGLEERSANTQHAELSHDVYGTIGAGRKNVPR